MRSARRSPSAASGPARASASRLAGGLTALAVGIAVLDDGGYSAGSRARFAAVALAAALAAAAADPARARRVATAPVLVVLAVLAVLGAASAAWTVGVVGDALRWGAVTAGFAWVAFAAAVLVRDARHARRAAALVALLAVVMGVIGLTAAALTEVPLAHRAAGRWRPAATFQYSPALALLAVSALLPLLAAMCRLRHPAAVAAAGFGGAVAGATLALAESRTQLAFAVLVCGAALVAPQRLVGVARGAVAAAVALAASAGLGAYAVAGGYIPVTPPPDGAARLLALAAVATTATAAWLVVRLALRRGLAGGALAAVLLAFGVGGAALKPAPRLISSGLIESRPHVEPRAAPAKPRLDPIRDQLLHGRLRIWEDAVDTFAERPVHGAGADSYFFASAPHQEARTVFYAHQLPLELAAELGAAGLLLALALYGTIGMALRRAPPEPGFWLLWPAAAAFPAANLVDWPWHLAGSGAVWALALGVMLAHRRNSHAPLGFPRACPGAKETE